MLEQSLLREQFETLLARQRDALGHYESLREAHQTDPNALAHFEHLCREKSRHIELTERLLEIVEE